MDTHVKRSMDRVEQIKVLSRSSSPGANARFLSNISLMKSEAKKYTTKKTQNNENILLLRHHVTLTAHQCARISMVNTTIETYDRSNEPTP
jgi:hypothetical protein